MNLRERDSVLNIKLFCEERVLLHLASLENRWRLSPRAGGGCSPVALSPGGPWLVDGVLGLPGPSARRPLQTPD